MKKILAAIVIFTSAFGCTAQKTKHVETSKYTVVKTDAEWRKILTPLQFTVTRKAGTESPYTGNTWNNHAEGVYNCICCDLPLFSSATKFESGYRMA